MKPVGTKSIMDCNKRGQVRQFIKLVHYKLGKIRLCVDIDSAGCLLSYGIISKRFRTTYRYEFPSIASRIHKASLFHSHSYRFPCMERKIAPVIDIVACLINTPATSSHDSEGGKTDISPLTLFDSFDIY